MTETLADGAGRAGFRMFGLGRAGSNSTLPAFVSQVEVLPPRPDARPADQVGLIAAVESPCCGCGLPLQPGGGSFVRPPPQHVRQEAVLCSCGLTARAQASGAPSPCPSKAPGFTNCSANTFEEMCIASDSPG